MKTKNPKIKPKKPLGCAIYNITRKKYFSVLTKTGWTSSLQRASIQTKGESRKMIKQFGNPELFIAPITNTQLIHVQ